MTTVFDNIGRGSRMKTTLAACLRRSANGWIMRGSSGSSKRTPAGIQQDRPLRTAELRQGLQVQDQGQAHTNAEYEFLGIKELAKIGDWASMLQSLTLWFETHRALESVESRRSPLTTCPFHMRA